MIIPTKPLPMNLRHQYQMSEVQELPLAIRGTALLPLIPIIHSIHLSTTDPWSMDLEIVVPLGVPKLGACFMVVTC